MRSSVAFPVFGMLVMVARVCEMWIVYLGSFLQCQVRGDASCINSDEQKRLG